MMLELGEKLGLKVVGKAWAAVLNI
jgi:hypothetical protein